ncbi:MAG: hypothetical protein KZQ58_07885 [gamma proteobacterium symbiont of Bathyaustriella thionipta]|nr:hypothetical protein [gamma proteobacterium symbiont of Bathyaustriella thionipta]
MAGKLNPVAFPVTVLTLAEYKAGKPLVAGSIDTGARLESKAGRQAGDESGCRRQN